MPPLYLTAEDGIVSGLVSAVLSPSECADRGIQRTLVRLGIDMMNLYLKELRTAQENVCYDEDAIYEAIMNIKTSPRQ